MTASQFSSREKKPHRAQASPQLRAIVIRAFELADASGRGLERAWERIRDRRVRADFAAFDRASIDRAAIDRCPRLCAGGTAVRSVASLARASPRFRSPYEIMRTVRAAGFDPLAPPLREGTTYVLRATDFRGILMRVVVDARSGAIRDANRIVPGPGSDAQLGMMSPYESVPDYVPQPYGPPPQFDLPKPATSVPSLPPSSRPPTARNATHTPGASGPPLPRPRPATLAARRSTADVERVDPTPPNPTPPNSVAPAPSAAAAIAAPSKTPPVVPPLND